ncbi:hypothetical protein [Mesorhizobium sp. 1B3]|uniref:hypothetical protein n=1 Tax=Mesorhizobium sp. 1B3 TaxID=3243599 RepID=UPI003D9993C3
MLTFGLADEAAAAVGTLGGMLPGGHGKGYSELLEEIRNEGKAEAAEFPKTHLAGQVAGGVSGAAGLARGGLSLAANAAQAGKGWLTRLLSGAADGAVAAGAYGAGSGEGLQDRVWQAARNAPVGAAFGAAGEGLAVGVGSLWRALTGGADDVARGANPAANVEEAAKFGIPLTRGQATRSVAQAGVEDQLGSQPAMQSFKARQGEAVAESLGNMQTRLAGTNRPVPDQASAWETVQGGLRNTRDELKAAGRDAYKQTVDNPNILVSGEAVRELPDFIQNRLASENIIVDPMYHQGAAKALAFIDDYLGRMPTFGKPAQGGQRRVSGPAGEIQSVDAQLRWLENMRAAIGKNFPAIGQDAPAIAVIKRSIDEWTDDIFERGLVSGSDDVLDQLKTARAKWSEYKGLVEPRSKVGGKINPQYEAQVRIRNMIEKDMSPSELGGYLFGSSVAAPKNMSFATAYELKRLLGPDSPEWAAVRQAVWLRATRAGDEAMSPARIAKNLDGLLNGDGKGLSQVVFSGDEREAMKSFANVMRLLSHPKAGLNNSNTANRLVPQLQRWGSTVMGMLSGGAGAAGGLDPLSSIGLGAMTTGALKASGAARNALRTNTAISKPIPAAPTGNSGATLRGASLPMVPLMEPLVSSRRP